MIHRFGHFELDEQRRELRLRGRELVLQPLIFDLLVYLVRNRDKVVSKDELLQTLWPDVIVADGALQRAVSLARSALRQGGLQESIRTYARLGYRFCEDAASNVTEGPSLSGPMHEPLERGRRALEEGDWGQAAEALARADCESALEGHDLERLGQALQNTGRMREALGPLERAVAAHAAAGDRYGAARAALQLAHIQLEQRSLAVATGWRSRAASFLEGQPESSEHGLLAWIASRMAAFEGLLELAVVEAERARDIGRSLEDPDLEALGLQYAGLALLAKGDISRGLALQDEAAATVLSGGVSQFAGSLIYCAVIWGCLNRADWQRAGQWTEHFTRWCERSRMSQFPGLCRLHRAEVLSVRGELREAEEEVLRAQALLSENAPYAEGDAYRVLGEIRLARGDLDGAQEAFRRAYELGWDPQPGRAILQVKQHKADVALRALERSLEHPGWANQQRRGMLLAHLVIVAVAAGDRERAERAQEELDAHPELWSTPSLHAMVTRARAELATTDAETIALLRQAIAIWQSVGSPLNVASLRFRLAELLVADGDPDTAELELSAAETVFRNVDAPGLLQSCAELRCSLGLGEKS